MFASYVFAMFTLVRWESDQCGTAMWWTHRVTSALAQGCFFSGVLACTCLLCSSDGVGAHCIKRSLVAGVVIGALTVACNMLQSVALARINCDSGAKNNHDLILRNVSSSLKSGGCLLSCVTVAVLYLRVAFHNQTRRLPQYLLVMLACWSLLLGGFSVAAETIYWLNDLDTKTQAFTWTGLFHCGDWGCLVTVMMWLCALSLQLTIYFAFREDAAYWNSLGLSIHADTGLVLFGAPEHDSEAGFDPTEAAHMALLRQKLARDLHSFRTSARSSLDGARAHEALEEGQPAGKSLSVTRAGSLSQQLSLLDTIPECTPGSIARQAGKLNLPFAQLWPFRFDCCFVIPAVPAFVCGKPT